MTQLIIDDFIYTEKDLCFEESEQKENLLKTTIKYKILDLMERYNKQKAFIIMEEIMSYNDLFQCQNDEYTTTFESEYVRIFTLGDGLCSLNALGDKSFSVFQNVKIKCTLTQIHKFMKERNQNELINVSYDNINVIIQNLFQFYQTNIEIFENASKSYFKEDGQHEIYINTFNYLQKIIQQFNHIYTLQTQSSKRISFLKEFETLLYSQHKLNGLDWPTIDIVHEWYSQFSHEKKRTICLFDNNPFSESEITQFKEWIYFSDGNIKRNPSRSEIESASDYIVFDNSHFSRVIPRKELKQLKEELFKRNDILVLEAREYYDDNKNSVIVLSQ